MYGRGASSTTPGAVQDAYRSSSCSSHGSNTTSPVSYHCSGGTGGSSGSQAFPGDAATRGGHMSIQDDLQGKGVSSSMSTGLGGLSAAAVAASSAANILNITPQAQTYASANWYMSNMTGGSGGSSTGDSLAADMTSSPVSAYANMFSNPASSQSCQLSAAAAFRAPYKNPSVYPTYDCNKY